MLVVNLRTKSLPRKFAVIYKQLHDVGILGDLLPRRNFPDEPQFYQYMCERIAPLSNVKKGFGYGCSENKSDAYKAAVAEAIEHYCILLECEENYIYGSYEQLKKRAVNPERFRVFTDRQLRRPEYKKYRFDIHTKFNWLEASSLESGKAVLIPAQLAYAHYNFKKHREPVIRLPISTGSACGPTPHWVIYRGLSELLERDSYMISYLNNIRLPKIEITAEDSSLFRFKQLITRYELELSILETTLDFEFTSILAITRDFTGAGPAVSAGLGGSLDPAKAIKTAALEAARRHIAARDRFFRRKPLPLPHENTLDGFLLRKQREWCAPHKLGEIENRLNGPKKPFRELKNFSKNSDKAKSEFLLSQMRRKGYESFYIDFTTSDVRQIGLDVGKVLVPDLLPLYYDERIPYLENARLHTVPVELGFTDKPLEPTELRVSHPF